MAYNWETAGVLINDAAIELGLIASEIADVYASTDQNIILLRRLLTREGRRLIRAYPWFVYEDEFTTDGVTSFWDLPSEASLSDNFLMIRSDTLWNTTQNKRCIGPVSPEQWAHLTGSTSTDSATKKLTFRMLLPAMVEFVEAPDDGDVFKYQYQPSGWVSAVDGTRPVAHGNVITFDAPLVVAALKLAFLKNKGFDTTAAAIDYEECFAFAKALYPGPTLNLTGGSGDARMLDEANIPETGFGS
jgi:hypothetical protein